MVMMKHKIVTLAVVFAFFFFAAPAHAQSASSSVGQAASHLPPILQNVGFRPQLNSLMPLNISFRDETGKEVQLGDYFHHQRPVLLTFVYFSCPMLCPELQEGVVGALRMISFNPGRDYEVVFVSFDDRDTPEIAAQKKALAMKQFGRAQTAPGWHFLTGTKQSILAATQAANFTFNFDPKSGLFAHASGIMLLTSEGRISRYFYGIEFPARDLRFGLIDASNGKIGSPIDQILCYCFQYDPSTAKYSLTILHVMRLGGVVTVLGLAFGIIIFWRRETAARSKSRAVQSSQGAR